MARRSSRFAPLRLPRSLLGQSLLAIAATLLIGQAVSAVLLYRAVEDRRDVGSINAAAFHLLRTANRTGDGADDLPRALRRELRRGAPDGMIDRDIERGMGMAGAREGQRPRRRLPPRIAGRLADRSPLLPGEARDTRSEQRLAEILARQGIYPTELVVTRREMADDRLLAQLAQDRPRLQSLLQGTDTQVLVAGMQQTADGPWIVARTLRTPVEAGALWLIAAQTVLLFLVLLGATYLVLRRITRPLARLTERVEDFAQTQTAREPLPPEGPEDVSRLIAAHNLLESRIASLLDEKDVMLGAIGHDLKTPLAALRVRIESVPDETQRARMAEVIEDLRQSLDDILSLARIGRAKDPPEPVQLTALAQSVVDEFEDMGRPVTLAPSERIVAPVQVTWLRRALRNLIENALRYGETASVSLSRGGRMVTIAVEDDGPGIPP